MKPISILPCLAALAHAAPSPPAFSSPGCDQPITRAGTELQLDGRRWAGAGANVYWLGLDENVIPPAGQPFYAPYNASYPSQARITEVMATVAAMGGQLVRSQTLGISVGNPLSLWPTLTARNPQAFETIDWAVAQARAHGLRLQVPLVDAYNYYHGGRFVFLKWRGIDIDTSAGYSSVDPRVMQFYTNATIVADFKDYLRYLWTHVSPYTGLSMAEDPTVAIIETGNELWGSVFRDMDVPNEWTAEIGAFMKSLAPRKLLMDGTYGVNASHFALPEIDLFSDHFYPLNTTQLKADIQLVRGAGRVFEAGEYDWTGLNGGDSLQSFFQVIEQQQADPQPTVTGDLFWSLFMHDLPQSCAYVNHTDGFTLHYGAPPSINTPNNTTRIEEIRQHLFALQDKRVGLAEPPVPNDVCFHT